MVFLSAGRRAPSDVKVTNNHQMLQYNLTWNFNGNVSDLDTFTVIVQANGERILQEDTRKGKKDIGDIYIDSYMVLSQSVTS